MASERKRAGAPHAAARPLSRARIAAAGLALVDREGADALTMRRLAEALRVTPMALYNHVADKNDLLRAVADELVGQARFDPGEGSWRDRIGACFRDLRRLCLAHPGAARLMELTEVAPAAAFVPLEITVEALRDLGYTADDALRAYFALVNFTLGQVSYEIRGPFTGLEPRHSARAQRVLERMPAGTDRAAEPDWDFDRAFEFGLSLFLDGIERRRSG